jgi:hypothetical protein
MRTVDGLPTLTPWTESTERVSRVTSPYYAVRWLLVLNAGTGTGSTTVEHLLPIVPIL